MTSRERAYGLLAATGVAAPWYFNVRYVIEGGGLFDLGTALRIAFGNALSSSFSMDLLIAFVTFALWSQLEGRRIGMRRCWAYPLLGLAIALAFAFPMFLLMRERRLQALASS